MRSSLSANHVGIQAFAKVAFGACAFGLGRHRVQPAAPDLGGCAVEFGQSGGELFGCAGRFVGDKEICDDEGAVDHVLECRRGWFAHVVESVAGQVGALFDDGGCQRFFGVEVVVEGALGHSRTLDDLA
jgi:hypothetical protein